MRIDDTVETIAKFFNDLIGALVPGMVFIAGLCISHLGPDKTAVLLKAMDSTSLFIVTLAVMFATGHALTAVFEVAAPLVTAPLAGLQAGWQGMDPTVAPGKYLNNLRLLSRFDKEAAKKRESYKDFLLLVEHKRAGDEPSPLPLPDWDYNDLRSVALSVSPEAGAVGRRFMFNALLCNGVGMAMILLAIDFAGCLLLNPRLLHPYDPAMNATLQIVLLILVAYVLFRRGGEFYRRAMTTPFAIAVAEKRLKGA